jgi:hypothetical protein
LSTAHIRQARVEGDHVSRNELTQLFGALALITVTEVTEVGVKMHHFRAKVRWQAQAECRKHWRKSTIGFLHTRINGTGLGNCHIGELSGLGFDWSIPGASTFASVCTDANKERVHHDGDNLKVVARRIPF